MKDLLQVTHFTPIYVKKLSAGNATYAQTTICPKSRLPKLPEKTLDIISSA
jgi:hypothetical protein